jgi:hypothetical protein
MQQEVVELFGIEPGQAKIEVRLLEVCQFNRQQFLVPIGPGSRAVHQEAEGLDLRWRPLVAQDDRNLGDAQLAGRFEP